VIFVSFILNIKATVYIGSFIADIYSGFCLLFVKKRLPPVTTIRVHVKGSFYIVQYFGIFHNSIRLLLKSKNAGKNVTESGSIFARQFQFQKKSIIKMFLVAS